MTMTTEEFEQNCSDLLWKAGDVFDDDMYVGYAAAICHLRMQWYKSGTAELPQLPEPNQERF